jgi:hypothetical protein
MASFTKLLRKQNMKLQKVVRSQIAGTIFILFFLLDWNSSFHWNTSAAAVTCLRNWS